MSINICRVFLLGMIWFPNIIFCQSDWRNGYVILNENDTIFGQIDHLAFKTLAQECKFRIGSQGTVTIYYPKDIKGYVITNFAYYVSSKIESDKHVFLEYLVNGKLNLYYIREKDKDRYFIQKDSLPLKEINYMEEIRTNDEGSYLYKSTSHVGLLALYTNDAPELYDRILHLKNDFNNLKSFTIDYHNIVCKDKSCISYRNKDQYIKIAIGPHFGYTRQNYKNDVKDVVENYFSYGLFVRFWSQRKNKNFSLRTGAIVSKYDEYDYYITKPVKRKTIVKIPLQFEYLIPIPFKVRPRVSLGFIYFTNYDTYFISGIGADMYIYKNISLSIGFEKGIKNIFGFGFGDSNNNTIIAGAYYQF